MDTIFSPFRGAHLNYNGYQLSETLMPGTSSTQVDQLRAFYQSTNAANVKNDIRYNILYDSTTSLKLSTEEGNAWVEVYVAFWKAVGEILKAEDAERAKLEVWISVAAISFENPGVAILLCIISFQCRTN
jgi:COP9 signalosome complex subunit 12